MAPTHPTKTIIKDFKTELIKPNKLKEPQQALSLRNRVDEEKKVALNGRVVDKEKPLMEDWS